MLVPATLAERISPSPAKVPPVIDTVAPARLRLSGSDAEAAPDSVTAPPPWVKLAEAATLLKVGASLTLVMPIVVVATLLRLNEPEPSLTTHVTVRVGFEPKSFGFSPALNVTESSTV